MVSRRVGELAAGDHEAQREVWSLALPVVLRDCAAILGEGFSAREVAVEVVSDFLTRYVHTLEHPEAARTYLRLMAVRRATRRRSAPGVNR